ncbi:MAG: zinc ribbon domain-containing protein [Nitrososphaerota archaeon]
MRPELALALTLAFLLIPAAQAGRVVLEPLGEVVGTVNGVVSPIRSGERYEGRVCVPQEVYQAPETRYRFYGWVEGGRLISGDPCLDVGPRQNVTARYVREHLVTLYSEAEDGGYVRQVWAAEGGSLSLEVPLRLEGEGVLYRLRRALLDGRLPLQVVDGRVTIGVSRPVTVQLVYLKLVRVNVTALALDGDGESIVYSRALWAEEGVLRLDREVQVERDGRLLRLEGHRVVGEGAVSEGPNGELLIRAESPVTVLLLYRVLHPVTVSDASGTRTVYAPRGEAVRIQAVEEVRLGGRRMVFSGWEGLAARTPEVEVRVNGSLRLRALYTELCDLSVQTPMGTQTRSLEAGQPTTVALPQELPATPFTRRVLREVYVDGVRNGPVPLVVRGCSVREVTAVYEISYDWLQIGLLAGGIAALGAGYVLVRRSERRSETARPVLVPELTANGASPAQSPSPVCPACGSSLVGLFCPACGSSLTQK